MNSMTRLYIQLRTAVADAENLACGERCGAKRLKTCQVGYYENLGDLGLKPYNNDNDDNDDNDSSGARLLHISIEALCSTVACYLD